ncbi:class I SAM-dependent methyltransferase [Dyella psychrodurans]|nr:class I SAM-dependent methyltransferase [Dyella psychrodurans]
MTMFDVVAQAIAGYRSAEVSRTISPSDTMYNQWYYEIGESAVDNIALAWQASSNDRISRVLDLPCGHGRVLRHLLRLFPDAHFDACDLDEEGVAFCANTFGARPLLSKADLTTMHFDTSYDLIWVGSLFTHISRDLARTWLSHLANYLSPRGMLVGTTHGRWCEHVYKVHPYISPEGWRVVLNGYKSSGYGYCDYHPEESHTYLRGSYGISLAMPHATVADIEQIPGIRLLMYRERAWSDHQDVFAICKPAFNDPWPGMPA